MPVLLLLALLLAAPTALAEHRPELAWMADYQGRHNQHCCSELDCQHVPVALIAEPARPGQVWVLVIGVRLELPAEWVHESEDTHTYWCYVPDQLARKEGMPFGLPQAGPTVNNTRCVFYAVGW